MKMIAKRFNRAVRGVRKNYEMFRHETSMRKPFFNKATCSSTKKEFLHILFPWKFQKMSRKKKKKPSEKFLTGLIWINVFTDTFQKLILADLFRNNLQNALSRCIMWNRLKDIFHSVHVWFDEAILV